MKMKKVWKRNEKQTERVNKKQKRAKEFERSKGKVRRSRK